MSKDIRASRPAVTSYKKAYKPLMSKDEQKRQRASFKRYHVNGGNDSA